MSLRRFTPERRAFLRSALARPAMLAALLLGLWGHVILVAFAWHTATIGIEDALDRLIEPSNSSGASLLNATQALIVLAGWTLAAIGLVQRRILGSDDGGENEDDDEE